MYLETLGRPYVLNLDRSTERLKNITKHLVHDHGLEFYRFPAMLGKDIDIDEVKKEGFLPRSFRKPRNSLQYGILGCMDSHRRMWQEIGESETKPVLVLEDDARLRLRFKDRLNSIVANIPEDGWDYINLCALRETGKQVAAGVFDLDFYTGVKSATLTKKARAWAIHKTVPTAGYRRVFLRSPPNAWTSTYLINPKSVPKLLAAWKDETSKQRFYKLKPNNYHCDWFWSFMAHNPEYQIDFYSLRQNRIAYRVNPEGESDLYAANK